MQAGDLGRISCNTGRENLQRRNKFWPFHDLLIIFCGWSRGSIDFTSAKVDWFNEKADKRPEFEDIPFSLI